MVLTNASARHPHKALSYPLPREFHRGPTSPMTLSGHPGAITASCLVVTMKTGLHAKGLVWLSPISRPGMWLIRGVIYPILVLRCSGYPGGAYYPRHWGHRGG